MASSKNTDDVKLDKKGRPIKTGKWTRRGFITAGTLAGGALLVAVAIRPGHQEKKMAKYVEGEGETLVTAFVKIGSDNKITAIIPHSEMGQGVLTALGSMLCEEMDVAFDDLDIVEAPAEKEYANFVLAREFVAGGLSVPPMLQDTINGVFLAATKAMGLQITGGSASVRFTGASAIQTAGCRAAIFRPRLTARRCLAWTHLCPA